MAEITITRRRLSGHGALRKETGSFVGGSAADYVQTKLSRILFLSISGEDTTDNAVIKYINSVTASTTQDDKGAFCLVGQAAAGNYTYAAYGY